MRLLILLAIVVLVGCSSPEKETSGKSTAPVPDFRISLFESEFGGYGYDILFTEKLIIHQPNIPAIGTNRGFPTRKSAQDVAALVVVKLKNKEMPPAVSVEEVKDILNLTVLIRPQVYK